MIELPGRYQEAYLATAKLREMPTPSWRASGCSGPHLSPDELQWIWPSSSQLARPNVNTVNHYAFAFIVATRANLERVAFSLLKAAVRVLLAMGER